MRNQKNFKLMERHCGGLKESSQMVDGYLKKSGHPVNKIFKH
ncbi:hypothetical protein [Bacillus sp. AFS051223]|nr:hypothetical protein [Bacillus sp. AFS051223]